MNERPKIRLELEVPAVQVQHYLISHNEAIEAEVKKGVDDAIKQLSQQGYLANAITQKILDEIRNNYTAQMWKWELKDELHSKFSKQLYDQIEKYGNEIIENIAKGLEKND